MKNITACFLFIFSISIYAQSKPNILWIVTDDHRVDAIESYNEITTGKKESALGYVSSPNIDKLISEGVLFTNAFCNSPACGPSRGSMLSGRYPFRNAHFAFEQTHQEPDFVKPSFPQTLQKQGYITTCFGKEGAYIFDWGPGQTFKDPGHYNYKVSFKHDLQKNDVGDFWNQPAYKKGTWINLGTEERVKTPDGAIQQYFIKRKGSELTAEDIKNKKDIEAQYEILRSYTRYNKDLIIGGENPMPAGETIDAKIVEELKLYLNNQNSDFINTYGASKKGANPNKPLLVNLGFHLPHTPVLPPKEYRDIFKKKQYKVPAFDESDLKNQPPQIHRLFKNLNFSNMTDKEKQQAIQDYYAFCAYGDALVGDAVKTFKQYCEKNNQEYLIIFTVGDHGWHLGEQGIEAKFGPWNKSTNGALIVVASDKAKVPEGLVQNQLVEYVDIAPTILETSGVSIGDKAYDYLDGFNLFDFIGNEKEKRDYIVGETTTVAHHRAYLRSRDFAFSMRTRPQKRLKPNENVKWALECPVEKAELVLYDLRVDPSERNNVAANKKYKKLADWFRTKLGTIVLGDGRIECDWSKANTFNISNFSKGAHNGKLDIPKGLIPSIK
ncbi:sulfatase-like hydrolase/transferase [Seonamhaeicola maritimus]|uniref:Sulfatase-like hydrolase/transferase n=1 Tax=Seonamhaeicola maritimus TaxID=2591822 RepID=A0A5C7GI65_9FLAO|nr:sulfatase-like hydrolase/transferase [Seonamhaeicola maritimus]TXG37286.1 sulfatase-like hydrolase/transferase [Seonamhaeicola maritimus]